MSATNTIPYERKKKQLEGMVNLISKAIGVFKEV